MRERERETQRDSERERERETQRDSEREIDVKFVALELPPTGLANKREGMVNSNRF